MKLENLQIYQLSMELGERIWDITKEWYYFEKETIGKQLVKAADSIAANISEGYGRYFYKDERLFCHYSRGSLFETKTWITKAHSRKLITDKDYIELTKALNNIAVKLNNYITSIGRKQQLNDN